MRMGEITFKIDGYRYAVDLDDPKMIDKARAWLEQDIDNLIRNNSIYDFIVVQSSNVFEPEDIYPALRSKENAKS